MSGMTNVRRARLARFRRNASKIIFEMLERRTLYAVQVDAFADLLGPEPELPEYYTSPRQVDAEDGLTGSAYRVIADHRENTGEIVLASFTDVSAGAIGDYSATIEFGDSTTAAGTIVDRGNGRFDVLGSHSYLFGRYNINVSVTDLRDSSRGTEQQSYAQIIAPAVAGVGKSITASTGEVFQGVVATFTGVDETLLNEYSANISWGDGYERGTLRSLGGGVVEVIGTHTFAKPGKFDMTITLNAHGPSAQRPMSWRDGAVLYERVSSLGWYSDRRRSAGSQDVRGRADVGIGSLVGEFIYPKIVTGIRSTERVAAFDINNPSLSLNSLEAVVNEYRQTTDSSGRVVDVAHELGSQLRIVGDRVLVELDQIFVAEKYNKFEVLVFDRSRPEGLQQVAAVTGYVMPNSHLSATSERLGTLPVAESFTRKLGTFSAKGSADWNSEFSVQIQWGDGEQSAGWLVPTGEGAWDVMGTHTYTPTGYYRDVYIGYTVTETRTPKSASQPIPPAKYAVGTSSLSTILPPGPIDGFTLHRYGEYPHTTHFREELRHEFQFGVVTVPDAFDGLTGTVQWSNGTASEATFETFAADRAFAATNHRFNTPGNYTGVMTVTRNGVEHQISLAITIYEKHQGDDAPAPQPVAPIASISTRHVVATKGVEWTGLVATMSPADANAAPEDFRARIYFGDGTSDIGQIKVGDDGIWRIFATHLFTEERKAQRDGYDPSYSVNVSKGEKTTSEEGSFEVNIDRTRIDLTGKHAGQIRQLEPFTATLLEIASPDPRADASAFSATIDWGDGTITAGEVVHKYRSTFELVGSHRYESDGMHDVLVTVTGPGGTVQTRLSLWAAFHPVEVSETPVAPQGFTVSGAVAQFVDFQGENYDHDQKVIDHATLIDWGDGTVSAGEIVANAAGGWDVIGTHTYAAAGDYTVSVLVRRNEHWLWVPSWWDYGVDTEVIGSLSSDFRMTQSNGRNDDFSLVRTITITGEESEAPNRVLSAPIATSRFSSTPLSRDAFDLVASESEVLETPSALIS